MKRVPFSNCRTALSRPRHGILTVWTMWIILTAGLCCSALFNVIWLSSVRSQAQHCTASAALAAGHSFLSDDMLRFSQQPFEYEARITRCQQAAINMVEEYRPGTVLPPITAEQVHMKWSENGPNASDSRDLVPHSIRVGFDESQFANRLPSFFGGLSAGLSSAPNIASSVALEHSPVGFHPSPHVNVPILPFAICDDPPTKSGNEKVSLGHWSSNVEAGEGRDAFSWNSEQRMFETGPDGLPEVTVRVYCSGSADEADAFIPLSFASSESGPAGTQIAAWIRDGLTVSDLNSLGRAQLSFPENLISPALSVESLPGCDTALREKAGEPCLIALCSLRGKEEKDQSVKLIRPVAARIVRVTRDPGDSMSVVLQPCILTTSTAITSVTSRTTLNRYVYSVRLSE